MSMRGQTDTYDKVKEQLIILFKSLDILEKYKYTSSNRTLVSVLFSHDNSSSKENIVMSFCVQGRCVLHPLHSFDLLFHWEKQESLSTCVFVKV
jgi:hypothetical protein